MLGSQVGHKQKSRSHVRSVIEWKEFERNWIRGSVATCRFFDVSVSIRSLTGNVNWWSHMKSAHLIDLRQAKHLKETKWHTCLTRDIKNHCMEKDSLCDQCENNNKIWIISSRVVLQRTSMILLLSPKQQSEMQRLRFSLCAYFGFAKLAANLNFSFISEIYSLGENSFFLYPWISSAHLFSFECAKSPFVAPHTARRTATEHFLNYEANGEENMKNS